MNNNSVSFFPQINKNEASTLFKAFLFFFFVLASWYALRPVRNELAVQGGIYNLPWLLMGVMAAMLIINPIYAWLVSRVSQNKIILYIYSFFIVNLIMFLLLWSFAGDEGRIWTGRAFYIWANVYSFFVVSIFWVTMINFSITRILRNSLESLVQAVHWALFLDQLSQDIFLLKFVGILLFQI